MSWNVIQRHSAPPPWDEEWDETRLGEGDFWHWMARTHGGLITQRAWENYWCAETWENPDERPCHHFLTAFDGIPGATEHWMLSTNADDRYRTAVLEIEGDLTFRAFMAETMALGRTLLVLGAGTPTQREEWVRELYKAEYDLRLLRHYRPEYSRHLDRLGAERAAVA